MSGVVKLLRDHPLMVYKGIRSWPPVWVWRRGNKPTNSRRGEVGILRDVIPSVLQPSDRFFIIMEHLGAEYIGTLLLDDAAFCRVVHDVLQQNRFKPIREIGKIDFSYTL